MQSEPPSVQVNFTDEFQRRLRTLSKKYRHIKEEGSQAQCQVSKSQNPQDFDRK